MVVERVKSAGGTQNVLVHQVLLRRLRLLPLRLKVIALFRALLVARIATAVVITAQAKERILTSASKVIIEDISAPSPES